MQSRRFFDAVLLQNLYSVVLFKYLFIILAEGVQKSCLFFCCKIPFFWEKIVKKASAYFWGLCTYSLNTGKNEKIKKWNTKNEKKNKKKKKTNA